MRKSSLVVGALCVAISLSASAVDKPKSKKKQTTLHLYMSAKEAAAFVSKNSKNTLFVDVRTRAEVNFLGMPVAADANVPYLVLKAGIDEQLVWDKKKKAFKLQPNNEFETEIAARLKRKGLSKNDPIILMCRSGSRSAKATNLLAKLGYKKVYTVVDGYEGGKAKKGPQKGQRIVNGWKNAGLPWTYKLSQQKMYKTSVN